jgi:hypothetical protein
MGDGHASMGVVGGGGSSATDDVVNEQRGEDRADVLCGMVCEQFEIDCSLPDRVKQGR